MGIIMIIATKPFSLCKSILVFGLQTMFIVIHTWGELVRTSITVHLNMFHTTMVWIIALLTLPIRVLTALQKEKLLQDHLHELQIELENLVWERKELQHQLQTAIKECKILESMIAEVEDENDSVIAKLELLESELQDLKLENLQLKEILGKGLWSLQGRHGSDTAKKFGIAVTYNHHDSGENQAFYKGSGTILEDLVHHKDAWEGEGKSEEPPRSLKTGSIAGGSSHTFSCSIESQSLDMDKGLDERRDTALSQSLFSALLSLLVGIIIWKAEDPCMPLVVALFAVVGMSLKSVVQFFSTIKNKPASDAVALLSFNWFILGTLTYPALPRLARTFIPLISRIPEQTMS